MTDYQNYCISGNCQPACMDWTPLWILGLVALAAIIAGAAIAICATWKQGRSAARARRAYLGKKPILRRNV